MATGYHPRRFDQSPLFQVVYHHFDHFREAYHRHYADYLGLLRPIVTHTINRFLLCGDPREGVARYDRAGEPKQWVGDEVVVTKQGYPL